MKWRWVFLISTLMCIFLIAGCAQQNPQANTGQTGQPQQPPASQNPDGQVQEGNTPPTETPPVQARPEQAPPVQTPPGQPPASPPPSTTPPPTQTSQTYQVTIQNFAFDPFALKINQGDTVVWTNEDSVPHTIASDSGNELASGTLSNGQTYSHTFNNAGTFNYHCGLHQTMKARVEVS